MTALTPRERIHDALTDPATRRRTRDGWITPGDLQAATGLDWRPVHAVLRELEDEELVEWHYGRPQRVRLTPQRAQQQQLLLGETA